MPVVLNDDEGHERAFQMIRSGGVVAFRTDTFYGLGGDPFSVEALRRIEQLKRRREAKPTLVLISDRSEVQRLASRQTKLFERLSEKFWAGALTLIVEARVDVPELLTAGTGTIGIRLPDDESVRNFIHRMGGVLTATSANTSDAAPARTAQQVAAYFKDEIALIVNDGESHITKPSTVVDATGDAPRLIREGIIPFADITRYLEELPI